MMADLEKKVNAIQLQALFKLLQYQALPPNKKSKYRKFSNEPQIFCHEYKIYGGLLASFKNRSWKFVNDKFPFMNNEPTTIDNLGIDRETFQKLFQTLHHEYLDPTKSQN